MTVLFPKCPTCGELTGHGGLPSALTECATRTHLIEALQTYAEMIDEKPITGQRFIDLFASVENRCGRGELFLTARVCEAVISLGWRPTVGGA